MDNLKIIFERNKIDGTEFNCDEIYNCIIKNSKLDNSRIINVCLEKSCSIEMICNIMSDLTKRLSENFNNIFSFSQQSIEWGGCTNECGKTYQDVNVAAFHIYKTELNF